MPTTLLREDDGICQLEIRGLLTKADLDRAQQALLDILASDRGRAVQLLVRLEAFEGWEPDPRWNDLTSTSSTATRWSASRSWAKNAGAARR